MLFPNLKWMNHAYTVAVDAGKASRSDRRRWAGQNEYDRDNMKTEGTRFTVSEHDRLCRCCEEAGITRYTLINYLLRTWMAAWEVYGRERRS